MDLSPLKLAHLRASSIPAIVSNDEDVRDQAILQNLVSYHGVSHVSYSKVDDEEYREWAAVNQVKREELIQGKANVDEYYRQESTSCPQSIRGAIYREIGINGEIPTLSLLEEELRLKDPTVIVDSDQLDRSHDVPGTMIRIRGRIDALIKRKTESGKMGTLGMIEVKTRIHSYQDKIEDKIQLTVYSRMMPKMSYYMLVERIHNKKEIKITRFKYEELTEIWDVVVPDLKRAYTHMTTIWTQRMTGEQIPIRYRDALIILVQHIIKIIRTIEAQGDNPAPMLADVLDGSLGALQTLPVTSMNSQDMTIRRMYNEFCLMVTPAVKLKIRQRNITFFRHNLKSLVGELPDGTEGYVDQYSGALADILERGIGEKTKLNIWREVDDLMSTV